MSEYLKEFPKSEQVNKAYSALQRVLVNPGGERQAVSSHLVLGIWLRRGDNERLVSPEETEAVSPQGQSCAVSRCKAHLILIKMCDVMRTAWNQTPPRPRPGNRGARQGDAVASQVLRLLRRLVSRLLRRVLIFLATLEFLPEVDSFSDAS